MSVQVDYPKTLDVIAKIFDAKKYENDDGVIFQFSEEGGRRPLPPITANAAKVQSTITKLASYSLYERTSLVSSKSIEIVAQSYGRMPIRTPNTRGVFERVFEDKSNQIRYQVSSPSEEYMLFLINSLDSIMDISSIFGMPPAFTLRDKSDLEVFEGLRLVMNRFLTIKISSSKDLEPRELLDLANSFSLHIAYNFNIPLVVESTFDNFNRYTSMSRVRRVNSDEVDAPHAIYEPELIHLYQMALSTDSPLIEFLSYYQIIEHFYDKVFNERMVQDVRDRISRPDFSLKREGDVNGLIKFITRKVGDENGRLIFDESDALKYVLAKYIEQTALTDRIRNFNPQILDYYCKNSVPFCDGSKISINPERDSDFFGSLASRIYAIRNAIVHSKSNAKHKFKPFRDERDLSMEIPLMRFVAEEIIVRTSKPI